MESALNKGLFDFIAASPSQWHTAENIACRLRAEGYEELYENERWQLRGGRKFFVRRNGSSLAAFRVPEELPYGFMIIAAHDDSPCFKLKEGGCDRAAGLYSRLRVEKYGGMICSSWMDRPLSVAGRVMVRHGCALEQRLVDIGRDIALIPSLAIHMDRGANDGKRNDPAVDMLPLLSLAGSEGLIENMAAEAAGVPAGDVISSELLLYCRSRGLCWGAEGEFISAPRLDNMMCVYGSMEGFLRSGPSCAVPVLCVFDSEEVGSCTKQGADSDFLVDVLRRAWAAMGLGEELLFPALSASFMVSADNAHAVHPNHPEYADMADRPVMNGGVVIKHTASQRYTTDAVSAAVFQEICTRAGVKTQRYSNRADIPGGSTLGHISTSHLGIDTVDVGLAQLAMHSAFETAGAEDMESLVKAAAAFYSSSMRRRGDRIEIY